MIRSIDRDAARTKLTRIVGSMCSKLPSAVQATIYNVGHGKLPCKWVVGWGGLYPAFSHAMYRLSGFQPHERLTTRPSHLKKNLTRLHSRDPKTTCRWRLATSTLSVWRWIAQGTNGCGERATEHTRGSHGECTLLDNTHHMAQHPIPYYEHSWLTLPSRHRKYTYTRQTRENSPTHSRNHTSMNYSLRVRSPLPSR